MKPGDDLDGLLRAFFRSRMPNPWPAPPRPRFRAAPPPRPTPPVRPLMRSRWVLAASAAVLFLGSLALPGRLTQPVKHEAGFAGPMTGDDRDRQRMRDEHKVREFENKNDPGLGADDSDEFDLSPLK